MKKNLRCWLIFSLVASVQISSAQVTSYCGSSRYDSEVFSNVTITSDVIFGANIDRTGANVTLTMDIYEPSGDTAAIRPLILWAHGGSFMGGTKNDADVTELANHFAKRGYVCASINYRLGVSVPPNQTSAMEAVFRAVQDMKAAIRYFRQDAATANVYKIDPDMVFCGGSSAGAFIALHLAYLDQPAELPSQIDTTVLGGMEGNSGNPGYSSDVRAIVNLCGALGDTTWMHTGDEPVCSMHGTNDDIVPYNTAMLYLLNIFPIMVVNGSYSVNEYATLNGIENTMYTFYGAPHVPYAGNAAYMDTTVRFVSNFLYRMMGCSPSDPFPQANTWNTVSVAENQIPVKPIVVYPNPATDRVTLMVRKEAGKFPVQVTISDALGNRLQEHEMNSDKINFDLSSLKNGIYFVQVRGNSFQQTTKLILNR